MTEGEDSALTFTVIFLEYFFMLEDKMKTISKHGE